MGSLLLGFAMEQCVVFAADWMKRAGKFIFHRSELEL